MFFNSFSLPYIMNISSVFLLGDLTIYQVLALKNI